MARGRRRAALARLLFITVVAGAPAAAAYRPVEGQSASAPPLAFQLNEIRKAWLFDNDAGAEARLAAIEDDQRLSGELPRWYASLRASLALKRGDVATAMTTLRGLLKNAQQSRAYLRAARLLVAFGRTREALELVREGRLRSSDSPSLIRYEADLLWLSGEVDSALAAYRDAILNNSAPNYPYNRLDSRSWDEVRLWPLPGAKDAPASSTSSRNEPFASLCETPVWYPTDLPGLERLLIEASQDAKRAAQARAGLDAAVKAVNEARSAVDAFRGSMEERAKLEQRARVTLWDALFTARIAALAELAAGKDAEAARAAQKGLDLAGEDIALLDILARALSAQGKVVEARTGPLRDLRKLANLHIHWGMFQGVQGNLSDQRLERLLSGALALYRKNPAEGAAEFNQIRLEFGPPGDGESVPANALGFWLACNGIPELAREYLREASRLDGFDAGSMQAPESLWVDVALLDMDLRDVANGIEPGGPVPAAGQRRGLLAVAPRAGFVAAAIYDRQRMVSPPGANPFNYKRYNEAAYYMLSARPDSIAAFRTAVWRMPRMLARDCTPEELDEVLAPESAESKALKAGLDTLADLATRMRQSSRDWNLRDQYSRKTMQVLGLVETRAMILRARLMQLKPATVKDFSGWLAKNQPQLDLRSILWSDKGNEAADDAARRLQESRLAEGLPEVLHSGVLMDAAREIARAGKPLEAARLLLFNPVPPFGADSSVRVVSLAAVLAQKGKDGTLAARCWMRAACPNAQMQWEPAPVAEYASARDDILEFGSAADLATYVENQYVPYVGGAGLHEIFAMSPELKDVNPALLMRNPAHEGIGGIFSDFLRTMNTGAIPDNWPKILRAPEMYDNCWRLAMWVIVSDLPTGRTGYDDFDDLESRQVYFPRNNRPMFTGLVTNDDFMLGVRLLASLLETRPRDAAAKAEAARLRALIKRCMSRQPS